MSERGRDPFHTPARSGRRRVVVALGAGSGFALSGALAQGLRQRSTAAITARWSATSDWAALPAWPGLAGHAFAVAR